MRADVINYTHFIVYYYVNSIIWLVGWLISLFRNIVHLGHYSPSVYNNNILTHQKSKTGGESLDREAAGVYQYSIAAKYFALNISKYI